MAYVIRELEQGSSEGLELRGAVRTLWSCKEPQVMVSGPAETGKTVGCLLKLNALAWKYPGFQGGIIRKTYNSMLGSVLQTFEKYILMSGSPVKPYGGSKPEWYDYPNGSRVWIGGMDNPNKVLSSERDAVYVNQCEELTEDEWETLLTRCTGRAGNMPYSQLYGDCNPGAPSHWIPQRFGDRLLESRHEDNPLLFEKNGQITEQGEKSLAILDLLTGVRKLRLRYGKWVAAEGVIFTGFDRALHIIRKKDVPRCNRRIEVVDFGFVHPFAWQDWHIDGDGRMYMVNEIYYTERLVEDHAKQIKEVTVREVKPEAVVCDHDAEDRATLERHRGCITIPAIKSVRPTIEAVEARFKLARDGRARFYVCADALVELDQKLKEKHKPTSCLDEVDAYVWNPRKDEPVKEDDHGMDNWRYGVAYMDLRKVGPARKSGSYSFGST